MRLPDYVWTTDVLRGRPCVSRALDTMDDPTGMGLPPTVTVPGTMAQGPNPIEIQGIWTPGRVLGPPK